MVEAAAIEPLRTPEEVAEALKHISPFTIRRLVSKREISYTPGARGKVLMSKADVDGLLEYLRVPAAPVAVVEADDEPVFQTSSRSAARHQKAS
ncbi:excise [Arthrobacter phage Mufasa8]|uniref:Excise n=1 Tax=Arthrobacter phage Mufasa8 TaxID=2656526 RepID=A0A649VN81_9CAUD|nr:excise [Arthrobacter phage Mufasa8]QGJ93489.1 excise [Arthrobacter phage Mufasa8]